MVTTNIYQVHDVIHVDFEAKDQPELSKVFERIESKIRDTGFDDTRLRPRSGTVRSVGGVGSNNYAGKATYYVR